MATATQVGSLLVQLSMDSAQFQREATKAQSKTAAIAKAFEVTSKDVYDASQRMGVSVSQFGRQMTNLVAQMNPAAQAAANYTREVTMLREALRIGAITGRQYGQAMVEATARMKALHTEAAVAGTQVTKSTSAMQAGMQQLNFQIGDMATMWAMGARPQQIFVSQASQVVQAISLMSGGAGRFATFMAGPWGMAMQAAVIVLSSIIPALLETEKAMSDVELASNGLADAQSALGEIFDLTTGKLKSQNEMLRLNAQITAYNLKVQAASERANYQRSMDTFAQGSLGLSLGQKALGAIGVPVGAAVERENAVRAVAQDLRAGRINAEGAMSRAQGLNFDGLKISKEDFIGAIRDGVSSPLKDQLSDEVLKSLSTGRLSDVFREEGRATRAPRGPSQAQIDDRYQDDLSKLTLERLNLEASYTQDIDQQYRAQLAEIDADLEAYKRNVELNKDLTPKRRETLIAAAEANAQIKRDVVETERQQQVDAKAYDLKMTDLQIMMDQAAIRRDLALSAADQRTADLELLDLQDKLKLAQLDRIMATEAAGTAAWDNARAERDALLSSAGQRRQLVERRNMTPMQQYALGLQTSVANINEAIEGIRVDAIDGMVNGLAAAAAGTEKLGDVFSRVAQQIISDIVRIQLQKAIVGSLGKALGLGGSTSINGVSGSQYLSGIGDTVNGWVAGARANGGPVIAGLPYLVGERGPEIVVPGASGQVIPNSDLSSFNRGGSTTNIFRGNLMTPEFWAAIQLSDAQASSAGSTGAQVALARKASRSIP